MGPRMSTESSRIKKDYLLERGALFRRVATLEEEDIDKIPRDCVCKFTDTGTGKESHISEIYR